MCTKTISSLSSLLLCYVVVVIIVTTTIYYIPFSWLRKKIVWQLFINHSFACCADLQVQIQCVTPRTKSRLVSYHAILQTRIRYLDLLCDYESFLTYFSGMIIRKRKTLIWRKQTETIMISTLSQMDQDLIVHLQGVSDLRPKISTWPHIWKNLEVE